MGDVLINSLMVGDCSERLCVRVSRTWDFYDPEDKTKLLHSDLVLIDEEVWFTITEYLNYLRDKLAYLNCLRDKVCGSRLFGVTSDLIQQHR
jgi:hypothetical protein